MCLLPPAPLAQRPLADPQLPDPQLFAPPARRLRSTPDPDMARSQRTDNLARSALLPPDTPAPARARVLRLDVGRPDNQPSTATIMETAGPLSQLAQPRPPAAVSLARQGVEARAMDHGYFDEARIERDARMRRNHGDTAPECTTRNAALV